MSNSTAVMTSLGFDWGDMAVERCFEHKGYRCVRIRSMRFGVYIDVQLSPNGRSMMASSIRRDKRLKGYDPSGSKETYAEIFKQVSAGTHSG